MKSKVDLFQLRNSIFLLFLLVTLIPTAFTADTPTYQSLLKEFQTPDYATYGEVPLWWWEGATMSKDRVTWQLETLADKGVKAVCPIQRSPGR